MLQEHVDGEQFEINLALADEELLSGPTLLQRWEDGEIVAYEPERAEKPERFTAALARMLGLRWGFVCAEWRRSSSGWKLIELHARPGDDDPAKGYPGCYWVPSACTWLRERWAAA